jgi:hypothetical protein
MAQDSDYVQVEVQVKGRLIRVRPVRRGPTPTWGEVCPGEKDAETGWSYDELRAIGGGVHRLRRLPP